MIPTNVVTGFLGVGKTTAVLDLLRRKPAADRWAVLVNEYGEVSIDHAVLEGAAPADGVTIREVAGGCVCCVAAPYLQVALHLLLTEAKPSRLIVETTGLGHPSRLLDTLRGPGYADRLDVRATLAIVSPDDFTTPGMLSNPVFREQVELADVLVLNKLDRATPEVVRGFQAWADELYPPKELVVATEQGQLDPAWLDVVQASGLRQRAGAARTTGDLVGEHLNRPPAVTSRLGRQHRPADAGRSPQRFVSRSGPPACGWVFHPADVFDESRLLAFLAELPPGRAKGVFRTPDDEWVVLNRVGAAVTSQPTSYRRDSRFELFADGLDWNDVEASLIGCLIPGG